MSTEKLELEVLIAKYVEHFRIEMKWKEAQEPHSYRVKDDYTPEELEAVLDLQDKFEALTAQGLEEGWLTSSYGDGVYCTNLEDLKHPTRTVVVPETEAEREWRLGLLDKEILNTATAWAKSDYRKANPNHDIQLNTLRREQ